VKKLIFFLLFLPFLLTNNFHTLNIKGNSKPSAIGISYVKAPITYLKTNIQRWAVLIGVSQLKYANEEFKPPRYADADASAFYEFLKSPQGGSFPDSSVKLLLNKDATLSNIRNAIEVFLSKANEDDIVVIFFSGHGAPDPNNRRNLYLITYDTDPEKMDSTGYPMFNLRPEIEKYIKARNVIVFIDASHSGGASGLYAIRGKEEEGIMNQYLQNLANSNKSNLIFTACEANELSQESKQWGSGHGVFTWSMLEGLKGPADENKDGLVTLSELIDFTMDKVKRETRSQQHPDKSATKFDRNLPFGRLKPESLK
jgi:uncharacterized caspase-like protein